MAVRGDTFGRLTVVEIMGPRRGQVRVRCDCGTERIHRMTDLRSGNTRSCGCLHRELLAQRNHDWKHGQARPHEITVEYTAWQRAKQRVSNPNRHNWEYYGGRGISMAPEWLNDFAAFYAHIGPKPDPRLSLDRIDNERGYEPGNVRWADARTQTRNRRPQRSRKVA